MTYINPVSIGIVLLLLSVFFAALGKILKNQYGFRQASHSKRQMSVSFGIALVLLVLGLAYPAWYFLAHDDLDSFRFEVYGDMENELIFAPIAYYEDRETMKFERILCHYLLSRKLPATNCRCILPLDELARSSASDIIDAQQIPGHARILRADLTYHPFTGTCRIRISEAKRHEGQSAGIMEGRFRAAFMSFF